MAPTSTKSSDQEQQAKKDNGTTNEQQEEQQQETKRKSEGKSSKTKRKKKTSYSCIRNLGLWRCAFFGIMLYEWVIQSSGQPRIGTVDLDKNIKPAPGQPSRPGMDRWFRYNHFDWVQDIHSYINRNYDQSVYDGFQNAGTISGAMAAIGTELGMLWTLPTLIFTILYALRFLVTMTAFNNHNYLYLLLMILTILSGGGDMRHGSWLQAQSEENDDQTETKLQNRQRRASVFCVLLRSQFMVVYCFAFLWKIHPDWLSGNIAEGIFLGFEDQGVARGVPWRAISTEFPAIFTMLALGGLLLDGSMFFTLLYIKPKASSIRMFVIMTLLFHCFTAFTMSLRIGYSFPATCAAGILVFLPQTVVVEEEETQSGGGGRKSKKTITEADTSLITWLQLYFSATTTSDRLPSSMKNLSVPNKWQTYFALFWVFTQFAIPLRMPIVSRGAFAYTSQAYRFSWTMMLHGHSGSIIHKAKTAHGTVQPIVLSLAYISPTCFDADPAFGEPYMPRRVYMPASEAPNQDERTLPLHQMLGTRQMAVLDTYPGEIVAPVAAGIADLINDMVKPGQSCLGKGAPRPGIGMHATQFAQLNDQGPYHRIIDPTINLVEVDKAQRTRGFFSKWYGAILDKPPAGYEYLFNRGVGSLRREADYIEAKMRQKLPENVKIYFLADRAACLKARPLWLRPMGYPFTIMALKAPEGMTLSILAQEQPAGQGTYESVDWNSLKMGKTTLVPDAMQLENAGAMQVQTYQLEITMEGSRTDGVDPSQTCRETVEEDVLFAFVMY